MLWTRLVLTWRETVADIPGMLDSPVDLVARDPHWRAALETYRAAQRQRKTENPEADSWVPRLRSIDGVPDEQLSQVHGRLIAHGLLKFQLAGQGAATGLEYQITPLGRRALGETLAEDGGLSLEGMAA